MLPARMTTLAFFFLELSPLNDYFWNTDYACHDSHMLGSISVVSVGMLTKSKEVYRVNE